MNPIVAAPHALAHSMIRSHGLSTDIRVFAACGDTMFRRGIAAVLDEHGGFEWSGEASGSEQAVNLAARVDPDVVVIDGDLPGIGCIPTLQALRQLLPRARFAVLLTELVPDHVRAAVTAGAGCVLPKNAEQGEIITALKAVHRGVWAHSPAVTQALTAPRSAPTLSARLTPRERDLLALMARGYTNSDIARQLSIAMPTVKFHVGHIMSKLGAENRTAAVLAALRHKLVDLDAKSSALDMVEGSAD